MRIIAVVILLAMAGCGEEQRPPPFQECMVELGQHPGSNNPVADAEWCRVHAKEVIP